MATERVPTGISGFDDLVEGGIPKGASVLLSGPCGSGKNYFAAEFLYRSREPTLFYTFEKDADYLKRMLSVFDWRIEEKIKTKQFNVSTSELYQFEPFLSDIEDNIDKLGAERVVLDSLTVIGHFFDSKYRLRKAMIELRKMLYNSGCTSLLLSEIPEQSPQLSTFGSEEFTMDGVIMLHVIHKDSEILRALSVRKMIGTHHDTAIHPYEVTKSGVKIHKVRELG
jgi:KaiC/GvpD/RAD55 family RecA-like ATPase